MSKPDLIERLENPDMCLDAVDDAIREITWLRDENIALRRHRFSLADALGYNTENEDLVPIHKELVRQVKGLVTMRSKLNEFRRFMRDEE